MQIETYNKTPLVIAITPPDTYGNEAETIERLLDNGVTHVHIRKPSMTNVEFERYLNPLGLHTRNNLTLHGEWEMAQKMELGGAHIKTHIHHNYNKIKRLSKSCHSTSEITNCPTNYQYVFLSPVFDSISKTGYLSTMDHNDVSQFLKNRPLRMPKVVALGGIDASNVATAKKLGFDGFALLGSLWHIKGKLIDTERTIDNLKKTISAWNNPL